jgi:very-short-patch-repair endonuclease
MENKHEYRVDHDNERDKNLSKHFNIYRIKWQSINSEAGKEYIKAEIEKFIKYYNNMKT